MGFKLFTSQEFKVAPNQEVEIKKPIELIPETRGVIHGVVHKCGQPAKDCVVKLFKKDCDKFSGVGFTFTDCFGQFLFPICATNVPHILKVFCLHEDFKLIDLKPACPPINPCEDQDCDC